MRRTCRVTRSKHGRFWRKNEGKDQKSGGGWTTAQGFINDSVNGSGAKLYFSRFKELVHVYRSFLLHIMSLKSEGQERFICPHSIMPRKGKESHRWRLSKWSIVYWPPGIDSSQSQCPFLRNQRPFGVWCQFERNPGAAYKKGRQSRHSAGSRRLARSRHWTDTGCFRDLQGLSRTRQCGTHFFGRGCHFTSCTCFATIGSFFYTRRRSSHRWSEILLVCTKGSGNSSGISHRTGYICCVSDSII